MVPAMGQGRVGVRCRVAPFSWFLAEKLDLVSGGAELKASLVPIGKRGLIFAFSLWSQDF